MRCSTQRYDYLLNAVALTHWPFYGRWLCLYQHRRPNSWHLWGRNSSLFLGCYLLRAFFYWAPFLGRFCSSSHPPRFLFSSTPGSRLLTFLTRCLGRLGLTPEAHAAQACCLLGASLAFGPGSAEPGIDLSTMLHNLVRDVLPAANLKNPREGCETRLRNIRSDSVPIVRGY